MLLFSSIIHCHSSAVVLPGEAGMVWVAAIGCSDSHLHGLVLTEAVSQTFPIGPLPLKVCGQPTGDSVSIQFGTWAGLSMLWCVRCQKAIPAFEGNSNYSLLGRHFSVSGFKQRQMIAVEDTANELLPLGVL